MQYWISQKGERDSRSFESALNMICFPKYIWSINFFFHFVNTSRFPWNLEHKKGDLKFSPLYMLHVNFSKISLWNRIRTPPPFCYPPGRGVASKPVKATPLEPFILCHFFLTDYKRSLKESPNIPFDAEKTPPQGLLKSPPQPQRTPLVIKKTVAASTASGQLQHKKKQPKVVQRPKALDFFWLDNILSWNWNSQSIKAVWI